MLQSKIIFCCTELPLESPTPVQMFILFWIEQRRVFNAICDPVGENLPTKTQKIHIFFLWGRVRTSENVLTAVCVLVINTKYPLLFIQPSNPIIKGCCGEIMEMVPPKHKPQSKISPAHHVHYTFIVTKKENWIGEY